MSKQRVKPATENEEQAIREDYDEFVVGTGQKCKRLHLPDPSEEAQPQCKGTHLRNTDSPPNQFDANEWGTKSVSVYPPGYRELCTLCVREWRDKREREDNSGFDCQECDRGAVGLVKVQGNTIYGCNYHYRKAIEEYADVLEDKRLLPEQ